MFIVIIALVVTVFVIKNKINHIQRAIESRIDTVSYFAEKGGELAGLAASKVARKAKKAVRNARK
jgi:hypothetical protein